MADTAPALPPLLVEGYARFRTGHYARRAETYRALAEGQEPPVMVIGCSDSRVDPAAIFDAGPGQLFVLRNVANLVPPCASPCAPDCGPAGDDCGTGAALEFAVEGLGVGDIVILGHSRCGGIRAYIESRTAPDDAPAAPGTPGFIGRWVSKVRGAEAWLPADAPKEGPGLQEALEIASIRHSLDNLLTFPFVRQAVDDGRLRLHGAHFSIADGRLRVLDPAGGKAAAPE